MQASLFFLDTIVALRARLALPLAVLCPALPLVLTALQVHHSCPEVTVPGILFLAGLMHSLRTQDAAEAAELAALGPTLVPTVVNACASLPLVVHTTDGPQRFPLMCALRVLHHYVVLPGPSGSSTVRAAVRAVRVLVDSMEILQDPTGGSVLSVGFMTSMSAFLSLMKALSSAVVDTGVDPDGDLAHELQAVWLPLAQRIMWAHSESSVVVDACVDGLAPLAPHVVDPSGLGNSIRASIMRRGRGLDYVEWYRVEQQVGPGPGDPGHVEPEDVLEALAVREVSQAQQAVRALQQLHLGIALPLVKLQALHTQ